MSDIKISTMHTITIAAKASAPGQNTYTSVAQTINLDTAQLRALREEIDLTLGGVK